MKTLPLPVVLEKNKLDSENPWLLLLDITLPDNSSMYFARNNEGVGFQGRVYTAIAFELDAVGEDSKGQIPTITLKVSNVNQTLEPYLQQFKGAGGSRVLIRLVSYAHIEEDFSELEMEFEVKNTSSDAMWVTFNLGIPNPMRKRFPPYIAKGGFCNWHYGTAADGWIECAVSAETLAAFPECPRTLEACQARGNAVRFGGQPGLVGGVEKIV